VIFSVVDLAFIHILSGTPNRHEQVFTQCAVNASGCILWGTGALQSGKYPSLITVAFIVIIYQVHHLGCD